MDQRQLALISGLRLVITTVYTAKDWKCYKLQIWFLLCSHSAVQELHERGKMARVQYITLLTIDSFLSCAAKCFKQTTQSEKRRENSRHKDTWLFRAGWWNVLIKGTHQRRDSNGFGRTYINNKSKSSDIKLHSAKFSRYHRIGYMINIYWRWQTEMCNMDSTILKTPESWEFLSEAFSGYGFQCYCVPFLIKWIKSKNALLWSAAASSSSVVTTLLSHLMSHPQHNLISYTSQ